jgi:hypothetical protein
MSSYLSWHASCDHTKDTNKLRQRVDARQWKHFDATSSKFHDEAREFMLSTYGMNPLGDLSSSSYNTWLIILAIYNLLP